MLFKRVLVIALIGLALFAKSGIAETETHFGPYATGFQVQNLENSPASISVKFYRDNASGGTVIAVLNDVLLPNGSKTYFPLTSVPEGFSGSALITANRKIAAVVNILGKNQLAAASYVGASAGNALLSLPLLLKAYYGNDTWFRLQNLGYTPATAVINYSDGTSRNATIAVGASDTFDQSTEQHNSPIFSAVISSNEPLAAVVVQEDDHAMLAYSGFAAGSTSPVFPLVNANSYGYITGIQIQNLGSQPTQVTVSYSPSWVGTACTETINVPNGQSRTFALYAFSFQGQTNSNCVFGAPLVGSARVTVNSTGQPLAAIVNQVQQGKLGGTYSGFDPNAATNALAMPLIMDRNYGMFTGISIMNVGNTTTNVVCSFTNTSYVQSATLDPGKALTAVQVGAIAPGYVGSGSCVADRDGRIVGIVNEVNEGGPGDTLLVYEAINQ